MEEKVLQSGINIKTPSEYAASLGKTYAAKMKPNIKQKFGQFFTPLPIARTMASFIHLQYELTKVRILEPGCGMLVLSACLIERLIKNTKIKEIDLTCYEIESGVFPFLQESIQYLKSWLEEKEIKFNCSLIKNDFVQNISSNKQNSLLNNNLFDYVISNPPFFKLRKDDCRAKELLPNLSEQPNIYSLFLFKAALNLVESGELIFLIPRSFCSGGSFRQFRNMLLNIVSLKNIHTFKYQNKIIEDSGVLSEPIIIKAVKNNILNNNLLSITCSKNDKGLIDFTYHYIFNKNDLFLYLPKSEEDLEIIQSVNSAENSLRKKGMVIKQGNVSNSQIVKFLAPSFKTKERTAPYYSKNYFKDRILTSIFICEDTEAFVIPNRNYIFFIRYRAKEEKLIMLFHNKNTVKSEFLFIDKQLNYIERENGEISEIEGKEIVRVINSKSIQKYIEMINGNLNLSAEMLLDIPL